MKNDRGEFALIGALIGLVGSVLVTYFTAANDAQITANQTGQEVAVIDMVDGGDVVQAALSTAGGFGAGWALDQLKGDDDAGEAPPPSVQVIAGGDAQVTVSGHDSASGNDQGNRPTTTTSYPSTQEGGEK